MHKSSRSSNYAVKAQLVRVVLLTTLLVLISIFVDLPGDTLFIQELQNSGHFFVFGVIGVCLSIAQRCMIPTQGRKQLYIYFTAAAISIVMGVLVEVIQYFFHRDADPTDILRDLLGIVAFLCGLAAYENWGRLNIKERIVIPTIGLCCLGVGLFPLFSLSIDYIQRQNSFPYVAKFGEKWTQRFISLNSATIKVIEKKTGEKIEYPNQTAEVTLFPAKYPGLAVFESEPDWSKYTWLNLTMYRDGPDDIDVVIRVHDHQHNNSYDDRFNQSLHVKPGVNEYRIALEQIRKAPKNREMDMRKITAVMVFAADLTTKTGIGMSDIFLSN